MEVLKLVLPPPPPFSFSNSTPPYTLMCLIVWSLPSTTQEKGDPQFPPKIHHIFWPLDITKFSDMESVGTFGVLVGGRGGGL